MIKPRNPLIVLLWSFALFILIHTSQYVGYWVASVFSGAAFGSIISGQFTSPRTLLGQGLTAAVLGIPLAILVTKFLWRRPWEWIRFRPSGRHFLLGCVLGIGLPVVAIFLISIFADSQIVATPSRFAPGEPIMILAGSIGWVLFIAITEELVFRGMAVREWAAKWGWPAAIVLGGVYFGAVHVLGLIRDINVLNALWIIIAAIVANLLFVALYIRGRSLWLPIGFHLGWNLTLESILGITISGKDAAFGLFSIETTGPDLITGGSFGMEASVVTMGLWVVVSILVLRFSRSGQPLILNPAPTEGLTSPMQPGTARGID